MYGATFGQIRINGLSSNLNNNRRRKDNRKPKKKFEEILNEEKNREPEQPVIHSRLNITF